MKALTTAGLTKLIQLIKSSFIKTTDTVTTNTVTLATVATSGSYNDLSNQPTIGNGTITFTQGGVSKGTITTNQTGNSTIALDAGGGTVDQTYDGTSANAQSGVAIAGELANYQETLTSGTNIKTINNTSLLGSGNIDTSEIFVATYGTTTYTDVLTAYTAGKTIIAKNGTAIYTLIDYSNSMFTFLAVKEGSNLTYLETEHYILTSSGWSTVTGFSTLAPDLSNLSATGKTVIDGQWVDVDQSIISSATSLNGSSDLTYRVDLPNDGHKYEVMLRGNGYTNSTAGNDLWILVTGNQDSMTRYMCRARAGTAGTFASIGTVICTMSYVASSEKNLTVSRSTSWNGSCSELKVIAYRRIGTNT